MPGPRQRDRQLPPSQTADVPRKRSAATAHPEPRSEAAEDPPHAVVPGGPELEPAQVSPSTPCSYHHVTCNGAALPSSLHGPTPRRVPKRPRAGYPSVRAPGYPQIFSFTRARSVCADVAHRRRTRSERAASRSCLRTRIVDACRRTTSKSSGKSNLRHGRMLCTSVTRSV